LKFLRAGGVAQAVEHLPSKHEALISNPNTKKKKPNRQKNIHYIIEAGSSW
jgi:hypothetical protein